MLWEDLTIDRNTVQYHNVHRVRPVVISNDNVTSSRLSLPRGYLAFIIIDTSNHIHGWNAGSKNHTGYAGRVI